MIGTLNIAEPPTIVDPSFPLQKITVPFGESYEADLPQAKNLISEHKVDEPRVFVISNQPSFISVTTSKNTGRIKIEGNSGTYGNFTVSFNVVATLYEYEITFSKVFDLQIEIQ